MQRYEHLTFRGTFTTYLELYPTLGLKTSTKLALTLQRPCLNSKCCSIFLELSQTNTIMALYFSIKTTKVINIYNVDYIIIILNFSIKK